MSGISILIVDDDLNKISVIIQVMKEYYKGILSISQASNVHAAFENLQTKEFHLLITDFQMPLKYDDAPTNEGGLVLLKNLYKRKNKVNVPMYIIGLTQFTHLQATYKGVWQIWHYDSGSLEWQYNLRDLITHISLVKSRIIDVKRETIFVEGPTDKKIVQSTIMMYYPQFINRVSLETISFGGGAAWVERQLFIWAKSLSKRVNESEYIKAVGIFDDDAAGNAAIDRLRDIIVNNSAEINTFSVIKNSYRYSTILKSIRHKGISFHTTLEELIHVDCWKTAKKNNWLALREVSKLTIDSELLKFNNIDVTFDLLVENGFSENECLITMYKVKDEFKESMVKYVCALGDIDRDLALISIKYLLADAFTKLKLI